ncbi:sulfatase [Deinococcus yavapaiensis]|uniref:Arylsulfatase A-like enzyme n=1 Tax=Deinococcus yavapaiensis KR-236 TaxID=694435 RepID=A0A318SCT9_9DEIO|nr:sulfatase [Deinococcus yavapaiensis]PYE54618.1 arylsulfatase A-like enzyme [Deinococcus yavapaiensis KR-236]
MNVIVIQLDSLNRHFLPAYGGWVRTPNIDAFAERAVIFDAHYTGSLPCMPARREIWAGVEEFWWRGWGPLEPWDEPVAYLVNRAGVVTSLVTDHYHFFEWGAHSYHHDFDGYEFVRGHEHDNWRTQPLSDTPDWATKMIERHGEGGRIYLRNVADFGSEADFFGPRVMSAAARWIDENHAHERFYLHVDSFDVHEPFHIPEPYRSLYTDADPTRFNPWPPYGRTNDEARPVSSEEIDWVRAQFAGKLTMVDAWLGRVFDALSKHDLWRDTCVILSTDHGHYLGEHDRIGKPMSPLWNTLTHVPLMIWHPEQRQRRVSALTQTIDLYATVLDALGVPLRSAHSRSLLPLVLGETDAHRDLAVYGYANQRVGVTDGTWTLLRDQDPSAAPPHWYSLQVGHLDARSTGARRQRPTEFPDLEAGRFIPGVTTPHWKMPVRAYDVTHLGPPRPDLLYHTALDPLQERDLTAAEPAELRRLEDRLRVHMHALGVPDEQYARLRL